MNVRRRWRRVPLHPENSLMAIELLNEHEQSELVRNWIRQNAGSILVGILIGLGLIVGWQQWQRMQRSQSSTDR